MRVCSHGRQGTECIGVLILARDCVATVARLYLLLRSAGATFAIHRDKLTLLALILSLKAKNYGETPPPPKVLLSSTELSKATSISMYPSLQKKAFPTRRWSYF